MFRRCVLLGCILAGFCLTGCATLPEYREDTLTTADVIRHIKCELRDAAYADPRNAWVRDWTVGLIFSFKVDQTGGIDADAASWTFPLNHGGTFVIGLIGGFSGQGTRTENINFKVAMKDLDSDLNAGNFECYEDDLYPSRFARLGGRLGISDLFERTRLTMDAAHVPENLMQQLDYNLDYIIKLNGSASPRFNLVPIGKEKVFTGSLKWSGMYSDTQSLKMTLTPPSEKKACPIVSEDGTPFKSCPDVFAAFPLPVKPSCPILSTQKACEAQSHCEWSPGSAACKARAVREVVKLLPGERREVRRAEPEGLSATDVQKNNAAQVQNLILDSALFGR